ncbi:IclR family transcriptional regulator domain-containing protein [Streptomyces mutabilis]
MAQPVPLPRSCSPKRVSPFMEGVHDVVGHHVQLGVLDGDEVLFLERLSAPNAVINYTRTAGRLPLYASSSGLVLLAQGPVGLRERMLAGPLTAYTPATPATPIRLRATLAEVRQQGYAYCPGYVHADRRRRPRSRPALVEAHPPRPRP